MFRDCFHLPWNGANIERSLILALDELQLGPIVDDHDRVAPEIDDEIYTDCLSNSTTAAHTHTQLGWK